MKKGDIILILAIFIIAAAFAVCIVAFRSDGKTLIVKQDNEIVAEYPLNTDTKIVLEHNTAVIKGGKVYMSEADCKNQICVKTNKISKRGECIVCLPNKVVLEIK